ncbi:MAG TPA: hypothetical protein VFG52_04185 [Xanthomonadales bacterium]|nr:hypothetical protein [Xanthomonadales bacterium]
MNNQAMSGDFEEYTVNLVVDSGKLEIDSPPQGDDTENKKNGWVGFARGKYGTITFALPGYREKPNCTDDPETSAEWVITEVVLSKFGNKNDQKGRNFGEKQTGWITHSFPTLSEDGYLVNEGISTARASAVLIDVNNNSGREMAFYQIEVRRCDGTGTPLRSDPGVGNGGRR